MLNANVTCPYCKNLCLVRVEDESPKVYHRIILHDRNKGCGRLFVIKVECVINITTKKIEGEEENIMSNEIKS